MTSVRAIEVHPCFIPKQAKAKQTLSGQANQGKGTRMRQPEFIAVGAFYKEQNNRKPVCLTYSLLLFCEYKIEGKPT
jgi:hypothetical protein